MAEPTNPTMEAPTNPEVAAPEATNGAVPQEQPAETQPAASEKNETHPRPEATDGDDEPTERAPKRAKIDHRDQPQVDADGRIKGVASIKKEYLVDLSKTAAPTEHADDDEAEANKHSEPAAGGRGGQKTKGGQNHARQFGSSRDALQMCKSRSCANEFDPQTCRFGDKCKFEHDIRKYLKDGKREDLTTAFNGVCPVWEVKGKCKAGWTCRLAGSHSKEIEHEDGRKELVLVNKTDGTVKKTNDDEEDNNGILNVTSVGDKITLRKKKFPTTKSDQYLKWLNSTMQEEGKKKDEDGHDNRAKYVEPPFRASEKRRIYYGRETPVLAPLTTQGNLPFRRLCTSLGAQVTWSEMAMGLPLLQGEKAEWALMKAHESESQPPNYSPKNIVHDYDNSKDIRFGAQIAANKPWLALKTTEVLTALAPSLRAIDLNCGCPIDLVCRQGAGSAMLDTPGKLEKTLRGMNAVSGEVPITVKIRMGTKDKHPTAEKLVEKLVMGGSEAQEVGEEPCGVAAITLHGRSKQQRYTRSADWSYISQVATLVNNLKAKRSAQIDTAAEPDARDMAVTGKELSMPYFCGNGDILSHIDYNTHMDNAGVDSCMIARGALIKPWIFEEIATNQYLDKSATERLGYIEQFARNGLEYWGSDEIGVGTTRRFLLEWLSFSCRYVPVGILEHLPPRFGDRPPAFRGRTDLETLLSSANYKDWIKISEMFLGPAHKDFNFQPKHKSNSYEIEAEG